MTDGRIVLSGDGIDLVHVSNSVPLETDLLNGGSYTLNGTLTTFSVNGEDYIVGDDGMILIGGINVLIIPTDNFTLNDKVYPKKGVYFCNTEEFGTVSSLTINGYTGF